MLRQSMLSLNFYHKDVLASLREFANCGNCGDWACGPVGLSACGLAGRGVVGLWCWRPLPCGTLGIVGLWACGLRRCRASGNCWTVGQWGLWDWACGPVGSGAVGLWGLWGQRDCGAVGTVGTVRLWACGGCATVGLWACGRRRGGRLGLEAAGLWDWGLW